MLESVLISSYMSVNLGTIFGFAVELHVRLINTLPS